MIKQEEQKQNVSGSLSILKHLGKNKDDSLTVFLRRMGQFDQEFCRLMTSGNDFTIKLEVRGDKGKVVHTRVYFDEVERPTSIK